MMKKKCLFVTLLIVISGCIMTGCGNEKSELENVKLVESNPMEETLVVTGNTELKTEPKEDLSTIERLSAGEKIKLSKEPNGEWYYVTVETTGSEGYIKKQEASIAHKLTT